MQTTSDAVESICGLLDDIDRLAKCMSEADAGISERAAQVRWAVERVGKLHERFDSITLPFEHFNLLEAAIDRTRAEITTLLEGDNSDCIDAAKMHMRHAVDNANSIALLTSGATLVQLRKESADAIDYFERKKIEAERILGSIGGGGASNSYKHQAKSELGAARFWGVGAIVLLVSAALTAWFLPAFRSASSTHHLANWVAAGFGAVMAMAVAIFAAWKTTTHYQVEQRYRRMALELESSDVYLASLPDVQRHKLKGELARRFFAQGTTGRRANNRSFDFSKTW